MKHKLFGTDGIRGTANTYPMTAETALRVGMAAGGYFINEGHRQRVVIGKDTRLSGYMLEPALASGFVSVGMDVTLVGPMPTPAIAMLVRSLRADLGVMLSASHNPYFDNGIKFFGPDGYKLSDEVEAAIESRLDNKLGDLLALPDKLGRARRLDDVIGRYTEHVKRTFPRGFRLDGLKIVVDCANGAAYRVAPEVLWELGAEVIPIGINPNGLNINQGCGSTDTGYLQREVLANQASIGLALDGDADRLMICDEKGALIDGDQIMALIANHWAGRGDLKGNTLVATIMSNLGLEKFLSRKDIRLLRTQVGDRYVVEAMRRGGHNLGGEQSGHIIFGDYSTTGDGLMAALQVLAVLVTEESTASKVCHSFHPYPQKLENVQVNKAEILEDRRVKTAIADGESLLKGVGRLLVRSSGTEPLIRVMAESEDEKLVSRIVYDLASVLKEVDDGS